MPYLRLSSRLSSLDRLSQISVPSSRSLPSLDTPLLIRTHISHPRPVSPPIYPDAKSPTTLRTIPSPYERYLCFSVVLHTQHDTPAAVFHPHQLSPPFYPSTSRVRTACPLPPNISSTQTPLPTIQHLSAREFESPQHSFPPSTTAQNPSTQNPFHTTHCIPPRREIVSSRNLLLEDDDLVPTNGISRKNHVNVRRRGALRNAEKTGH
ncbi:hypothetical protein PLEOSDRAFT_152394 [Pleurotus ostreatus PC15]|uniref:Uncharacterized protein n=1 Tax=Pleurotus ostreatus (strain PC15) TaxID=1137138 RepID=A0A067P3Z5_PLEO1|nr:hypothetical protein PLEOSDRAFT_152394 [Pleurotus ostreatus PC15]